MLLGCVKRVPGEPCLKMSDALLLLTPCQRARGVGARQVPILQLSVIDTRRRREGHIRTRPRAHWRDTSSSAGRPHSPLKADARGDPKRISPEQTPELAAHRSSHGSTNRVRGPRRRAVRPTNGAVLRRCLAGTSKRRLGTRSTRAHATSSTLPAQALVRSWGPFWTQTAAECIFLTRP